MTRLTIDTQMMTLERLLDSVEDGEVAVPDFQRLFVWSDQQIRSLLGTVLNGWPAGSLLIMRGETEMFRVRELELASALSRVKLIILDGQQRLTALFSALRNVGPNVYALNLRPEDGDFEDVESLEAHILSIDRFEWDRSYSDPAEQGRRGVMPLAALRSPTDFFEWRDAATAGLPAEDQGQFSTFATDLYRDRLSAIHRYSFPAVALEGSAPVAAIARIFEKVNRSGTQLSTFDLMVARLYQPDWNLRDRWTDLLEEQPSLGFLLESDGLPLLEAIALRHERNIRRSAVLDLEPSVVRANWDVVSASAVQTARALAAEFGVRHPDWLPYGVMFVAMDALAANGRDLTSPELKRWFWSRAFGLGFDAPANTRIVSDYIGLTRAEGGGVEASPVSRSLLTTATRRSHRAMYFSFLCLLASRGAVDLTGGVFREPEPLGDVLPTGEVHRYVGSIVPRGLAYGRNESAPHLRAAGVFFVGPTHRRRLQSYGLPHLVRLLLEEQEESELDAVLESQLLPSASVLLELEDDWRALLDARAARVAEVLRSDWDLRVEATLEQ